MTASRSEMKKGNERERGAEGGKQKNETEGGALGQMSAEGEEESSNKSSQAGSVSKVDIAIQAACKFISNTQVFEHSGTTVHCL